MLDNCNNFKYLYTCQYVARKIKTYFLVFKVDGGGTNG